MRRAKNIVEARNIRILITFQQEMETVSQVRETLTRSLENAKDQLKASREAKHQERQTLAETAPVFLSHPIFFLSYP